VHDGAPVVVFSGGGTGGHLYPALALSEALSKVHPEIRPFFIGASRGVEARILPARGVDHLLLPVEGFARGGRLGWVRALPRLATSLLGVAELFRGLRPRVVVVTGGYAAAPAGIVSRLLGIPLLVQEQNAIPGLTTRLLSRSASFVHVAYPEAVERLPRRARARARVTGNPVRAHAEVLPSEARRRLGLPEAGRLLLVVGGSQGSAALNRLLLQACADIISGTGARPEDLHVLWSTGPRHWQGVADRLVELGDPSWVTALPYLDDMPSALAASDLAISRAGAMATAELLAHGLPAILVPFPAAAADHQSYNAAALAEAGAAVTLEEEGLTGGRLWEEVLALLSDGERMRSMAERAHARARPDAANLIARDIASLVSGAEV
jgi:UDP-N-acetylglucosamine--N-acetylmuramyl-(pentapeptide) pyrophosphoryl-undecaprenol N-acetylglucosamine transferase